MKVRLYVCPTAGCPSYFGSDSMGDLEQQFSGPKVEDRIALSNATGSPWRKSRADCPHCLQRNGERIARQPIEVEVPRPPAGRTIPLPPVASATA